jgi:glycosyltransferase involved in cell wall biosynthesis
MARDLARSPLVFVFPAGSEGVSGGNIYNRELVKALAELVPLSIENFAEAAGGLASGHPGTYVFDTLELDHASMLPSRSADQHVGLVVHHLPSLEPGADHDARSLAAETARLRHFDFYVATSNFTRDLLAKRGLEESAILTVPPGTSSAHGASLPQKSYEAPLSAVVVANLIPRKGVLELLEALAHLKPATSSLSIRVIGRGDMDPAYAEACRRTAAAAPSLRDIVRLEGPIPHAHLGEVYEASHLFVSAAFMETFGMAVHEARAHGLPILAIDGGYVSRHFTHGDDGFSCASHAELAEKLVELAGDERRMTALFERARETRPVSFTTWREAAERFLRELGRSA